MGAILPAFSNCKALLMETKATQLPIPTKAEPRKNKERILGKKSPKINRCYHKRSIENRAKNTIVQWRDNTTHSISEIAHGNINK